MNALEIQSEEIKKRINSAKRIFLSLCKDRWSEWVFVSIEESESFSDFELTHDKDEDIYELERSCNDHYPNHPILFESDELKEKLTY